MNEQNLIGKGITNSEQARELGRLGGSKSTPAKKLAAQLRELKKKDGLSDKTAKTLYDLMIDSDFTDLDILIYVRELLALSKTPAQKREALKVYLEWRRTRHGTKEKIEQNINVEAKGYQFIIQVENKKEVINVTPNNQVEAHTEAIPSIPNPAGQGDN